MAATRAEYRLILCGKAPKMDGKKDTWLKRALADLPAEWLQPGEYTGPAWGADGQAVMVRCASEIPEIPSDAAAVSRTEEPAENDFSLLDPIPVRIQEPRPPEHTAALTVGKLVHKGIELWRFPEEGTVDPVLDEVFRKILMQTDRLAPDEQLPVLEKARMLLSRFRNSEAFSIIASAESRRHEIPFSFMNGNFPVNGIIDLLMRDRTGYTIVDFKTDELKSVDDLTAAYKKHSKQLGKYRRALRITLGEDPHCMICFLDYCGKVILEPVGKDAGRMSQDDPVPDDWLPDEEEPDGYWIEEGTIFSEPYDPEY